MTDRTRCPRCGAQPEAADAPEGLCPRCLLETGLASTSGQAPTSSRGATGPRDPVVPAPDRIGPYRILGTLGEGGLAVVYLAQQERPVRRRVAVKLIKPGMDSKQVLARFELERQAMAILSHPGIAKVFDAGITEQGRPYFAMEHVPGIPITDFCDRQRLGLEQRLGLFVQVCQAVHHAHQKGIIHRDLKPSNVLVALEDGRPVPKVIDFGVAKATNRDLTERTLFTAHGYLIGTPEYMSPEQVETTPLDIDTMTDIYALGVLLYELLVGALPFDSRRLREAGLSEMQRIIREEEPPRPSDRASGLNAGKASEARQTDPGTLRRRLRGDLDWITMRALEKDRTRRYGSASEFAADVSRHLQEEPVLAGPPSAVYRFKKMIRRNRGPVVAAALVLLSLVTGLGVSTTLYLRAEAARGEALREKAAAEWQSYLANLGAAELSLEKGQVAEARRRLDACPAAHRGWEWLHLELKADSSMEKFAEHATAVTGLAVDSRWIVSGSWDSVIHVRDRSSGRLLRTIELPTGKLQSLSLSPGGDTVAVANSGSLSLVSLTSGEVLRSFGESDEWYGSVTFSPDGGRIVATALGQKVNAREFRRRPTHFKARVWQVATEKPIATLSLERAAEDAWLSFDGARLATRDRDSLRLWDVGTGRQLLAIPAADTSAAASSPDWTRAVVALRHGEVRLYDLESGEVRATASVDGLVTDLAFSADGRRFASGAINKRVRVWDAASGEALQEFLGHEGEITGIRFTPDGRSVVSASTDGTIRVWDPLRSETTVLGRDAYFTSATWSADGEWIAAGSGPTSRGGEEIPAPVWIWRAEAQELVHLIGHVAGEASCVAFDPSGSRLAAGYNSGTAALWNVDSGALIRSFPDEKKGERSGAVHVAFAPDGQTLATSGHDGKVRLWDPGSGKLLRELAGHESFGAHVAYSPDGTRLVSTSGDGTLRIWDPKGGAVSVLVAGEGLAVWSAAYSADGTRIASGDDRDVRIWSSATGEPLQVLSGHEEEVMMVSWAPDGSRLASASIDGLLRIWHVATGELLMTLRAPLGGPLGGEDTTMESVAFSPDGHDLVTAGAGAVRVWRSAPPFPATARR